MFSYLLVLSSAALGAHAACYDANVAHPILDYQTPGAGAHIQTVSGTIRDALSATIADKAWDAVSFSVEVTSSKDTLFSHHHTARTRNTSRPDCGDVSGDCMYRIASVTKSFTVLALLRLHARGELHLDDSVDKYIPEFAGAEYDSIDWSEITLRSLASQSSGLPRECTPKITDCGTLENLMNALKGKKPLFAPNQRSSYSNIGYQLLGVVISRVSKMSYEKFMEESIFKPLEMTKTTFRPSSDTDGVIPAVPNFWGIEGGIQNPTGGLYSSTGDLARYMRHILTHHNTITPTLNWLTPASTAEGLNSFYGAPWEIFRTERLLESSRRTVEFITKTGGLPGYVSDLILVPQYDLGITLLIAGGNKKIYDQIKEILTTEMVRAADAMATAQLRERYAGVYSLGDAAQNTSMTVTADARGLIVTGLIAAGQDFLKSKDIAVLGAPADAPWHAQLVPTQMYEDEEKREGERWRLLVYPERPESPTVWDEFCVTDFDKANMPVDYFNEVVFWKGADGGVEKVALTGFQGAELTRTVAGQRRA
ncbi:beta-lactamase/transpeptidase-like protein [Sporormia fimetaria CBS 119925]|uniref:Beta-lactamase/transpeptidase-like protein n=1 Tax=Sporormia fimetaria CBS 119925 TaxID=1340428 RepID=A0A6A6V1C2_9PLEO|nr:beta-lactamase/transpeptidase-like protein [Sporormia fimetaria CBS 119925]